MKLVKLASNDSGEFELGLTQDPSEITNKSGYRVLVSHETTPVSVIGVEQVGASGTWEVLNSENFVTVLNGILQENMASLDGELLKSNGAFYVEITKNVAGDAFRGIQDPWAEMDKIINAPNSKIEESRFVHDYAVFFLQHYPTMCEADKDYPEKYNAAMKRWNTEVGQLNAPVDVVNTINGKSEIIFTIPPMLATNDIFNNSRGLEIHEILHESAFIGQTNPGGAEDFIAKQFSSKLDHITENERRKLDLAKVRIYDDIRARYNIPRWLPEENAPATANATSGESSSGQSGFGDNELGQF